MKITGAYGGASYGNLSVLEKGSSKTAKELSTGKKVNAAEDDAAGMSILQKTEAQSKEYSVKIRSLQNEISSYQAGDSGLESMAKNINILKELAVKAGNDTLSDSDKDDIKAQAESILEEIDGLSSSTEVNTKKVLENYSVEKLGLSGASINDSDIIEKLDKALETVVEGRGDFGTKINASGNEAARLAIANENSTAAISKIEDADMLISMMNNTKNKIMQESNNAVNVQAKISQQRVLDILKD